jgi:hypothetical protein
VQLKKKPISHAANTNAAKECGEFTPKSTINITAQNCFYPSLNLNQVNKQGGTGKKSPSALPSNRELMYKKKQDEIIQRIQNNMLKSEQLDQLLLKQSSSAIQPRANSRKLEAKDFLQPQ